MTSLQFALTSFLNLEYGYGTDSDAGLVWDTVRVPHALIKNTQLPGEAILVQKSSDPMRTQNTTDLTALELPDKDGRYVLLDEDSSYPYPSVDSRVTITDVAFTPQQDVIYDRVRVHIMAGYQFQDCEGFVLSMYVRTVTNEVFRLCSTVYLKSDPQTRLHFNPRPMKLADRLFDKYLQILVPSLKEMQIDGNVSGSVQHILTEGRGLAQQQQLYCEFRPITNTKQTDGITYLIPAERTRFAIPSVDQYQGLTASVRQATDGDYFLYEANYNGQSVEDYLFQLNAMPGQDFMVIHELRVLEQVGEEFRETHNQSSVQISEFSTPFRFRPVLLYGSQVTSLTLEYTVRLFNRIDGRSIFKESSLSTLEVGRYGKRGQILQSASDLMPVKVYNQVAGYPAINPRETLVTLTKTKTVTTYVDQSEVRIHSIGTNGETSEAMILGVNPFDNLYRLYLMQIPPGANSDSAIPLQLDPQTQYALHFAKSDGTLLRVVAEALSDLSQVSEGELLIKLPAALATEVRKSNDFRVYLVAKAADGSESMVASGQWSRT